MPVAGERVWAVPAYLPFVQPPLDAAAVADAERRLEVRLPAAYVRLLEVQNGGYLRTRHSRWPAEMLWGIGPGFPSLTGGHAWWQGDVAGDDWAPDAPHLLVPFDGDGHWNLCLDYRDDPATDDPPVTFVDVEDETESLVAPSFEAFLAGLDRDVDAGALRSHVQEPIADLAARLSASLRLPVTDQGAQDHGYPVLRVGADGSWAWISPNRVPSGFSRDRQGLHTTEAWALRLPEDPGCVHLVSCTDDLLGALRLLVPPAPA